MCREKSTNLSMSRTITIVFAMTLLGELGTQTENFFRKNFKDMDELVKIGVRTRIRQIKVAYTQSYIFIHNIRNM